VAVQNGDHCIGRSREGMTTKMPFSRYPYRNHGLFERFIKKLKQLRHIATRHDRKASAYLAFAKHADVRLWLSSYASAAWYGRQPCKHGQSGCGAARL